MPFFVTWKENDEQRKVSIKDLNELQYLIGKRIYKFCLEYFEYEKQTN